MTISTLCIRLPLLRGPLPRAFAASRTAPESGPEETPESLFPKALRLWPGLPGQPEDKGWHCPGEYPFNPREAAACLEDLRHLGDVALSGLNVGATAAGNARAARRASELALLEGLSGEDNRAALAAETARRTVIEREQAQKALLWAWLQEERLAELAALAHRWEGRASGLAAALGVEEDEDESALSGSDHGLYAGIALDPGLIPPWRLVAANAAWFLPPEVPLLAEGPMAEDLLENLAFRPASRCDGPWSQILGCTPAEAEILTARAPLWRAMGRTRPTNVAALDMERVWIIGRGA